MNQRTKYRKLILTKLILEQSLHYYKWQVKLKKQMGDKYQGLSLSALRSKVSALKFSISEFDKLAESQNPNPGKPAKTNWGL